MDIGFGDYLQFVLALFFVLGLFAVLVLVARRLGFGYRMTPRTEKRRLSLVEVISLDPKRRLALIRRDATEHLILLGANADILIESNISAADHEFSTALKAAQIPASNTAGST